MKKKQKAPKRSTALKPTRSSEANTSLTESRSKWIRTEAPFRLPVYVKSALRKLHQAGHEAYVVGGSVRDFLLGRPSKDHDIATSALPDEICELFTDAIDVGKSFGVIKIPLKNEDAEFLEIATFRVDLEYLDHRHPTRVKFTNVHEDASRRDFTINALYYDVVSKRILDPVGGFEDLSKFTIRSIGKPKDRFNEDALRLLRAVRFTVGLGFKLDPETEEAIRLRARLIKKVSVERIRDELSRIFTGPRASEGLKLLTEVDLLDYVLPEVERLKIQRQGFAQTIRTFEIFEKTDTKLSEVLAWATVLQGLNSPGQVQPILARYKFSNVETAKISFLVEGQSRLKEIFEMREAKIERWVHESGFEDLLELHRAMALATDGNLAYYEFAKSRFENRKKTSEYKLLKGEDLIQLGFRPGPEFSEILRVVEDLALESQLQTKEQALHYVLERFVR